MKKPKERKGFFKKTWVRILCLILGVFLIIILSTTGYIYVTYLRPIQKGNTEKMLALAQRFQKTFENQDITDWTMHVSLETETEHLQVNSSVIIKRSNIKTDKLYFLFNPGLTIEELTINGNKVKPHNFWFLMWINIPKQIFSTVLQLKIIYRGTIKPLFKEWYCGGINSRQTVLWDASLWYPQESFLFADRFNAVVTLETPDSFTVVVPGNHISESIIKEKKITTWEINPEEGRFPLVAGMFRKWETRVKNKQLSVYAPRNSNTDGAAILDHAQKGLDYYLERFGDPGRDQFSFFIPDTRQMYSMYGGGGIFLLVGSFETVPPSYSLLINHELAHNWIPGVVDVDWIHGHDWISEGFCEYSTLNVAEHTLPSETYLDMKWAYEAFRPHYQKPLSQAIGLFGDRVDAEMSYQKGAYVYLMMEQIIGENEFQKALASVIHQYRGQIISPETYLSALNNYTSPDLEPFYQDWVYHTGMFDFSIEKVTHAGSGHSRQVTVTIRNQGDIDCPYPVKIACISSHKTDIMHNVIPQTNTEIIFRITGDLQKMIIDPELNWADMNRANNIYPLSEEIVAAIPSNNGRLLAVVKKDYSQYAANFHRWSFDHLYLPAILEIYNFNGKQLFQQHLPGSIMIRNYSIPQWDRSGQKLLFRCWDHSARISRMMLYHADSNNLEELGEGYTPQWGDDNPSIIFGTTHDVILKHLETGKNKIIKKNIGEYIHPHVSPSGKKIYIINKNKLTLIDIETGKIKNLFSGENLKRYADWSADSRAICFITEGKNEYQINKYEIKTGAIEVLLASPFPVEWIQYSKGGQYLLYVTFDQTNNKNLIHLFDLNKNKQKIILRTEKTGNLYPLWIDNTSFCYPSSEKLSQYPSSLYNTYHITVMDTEKQTKKVLFLDI